jgi:hypothetical protein
VGEVGQIITRFTNDVAFVNGSGFARVHPVVEFHVDGVDGQLLVLRVVKRLDHQVRCEDVRRPLLAFALVDVLSFRQIDPKSLL